MNLLLLLFLNVCVCFGQYTYDIESYGGCWDGYCGGTVEDYGYEYNPPAYCADEYSDRSPDYKCEPTPTSGCSHPPLKFDYPSGSFFQYEKELNKSDYFEMDLVTDFPILASECFSMDKPSCKYLSGMLFKYANIKKHGDDPYFKVVTSSIGEILYGSIEKEYCSYINSLIGDKYSQIKVIRACELFGELLEALRNRD